MKLRLKTINSLQKVFPEKEPFGEISKATMLSNEIYNYQIALCSDPEGKSEFNNFRLRVYPEIDSPIKDNITLRRVENVPSQLPAYEDHDDYVEKTSIGLYPDPLLQLDGGGIFGKDGYWYSLWVQIDAKGVPAGKYPIEIMISNGKEENTATSRFEIEILPQKLKKQELIYTSWFHADCLYTYYDVPAFSQKHWDLIKEFMTAAASRGMNMILTPIFTPPLDTAIGGERPTIQLIDVFKDGNRYTFDFKRLKKWINLAKRCGIEYIEFAHLFTQWGAAHAPKIMAYEKGELQQIFGWKTNASGKDYTRFLSAFLPALSLFVTENKLTDKVFFHISDEPGLEHIENYKKASNILKKYLSKEFRTIEALSNYEFYETGLIKTPIPSNDHIEPFYKNGVENLWTYYCCGQYKKVSNRFFCMPSERNRILGFQLYKYNIEGFLQWGFNFWYTQFSHSEINPWITTDSGGAFPSGDPFVVYPGKNGKAVQSLRNEVFFEALQDLRALKTLETKIGRDEVIKLLEKDLEQPLTMEEYPHSAEWLLQKRQEINELIKV